ncbi:LPS-assembly protein LptD [Brevundimonas sp. S30B]|uniref:LPS-assembly protein LptD n=1 Tax=unclassified Brevundimonas TaxID=2622653 RepID=UPI001072C133|nr:MULTISPECIES: LPS assembly protein LptD [unclassified Brevundimonas]QBX37816.1 LPS-assembly protein LptD [Brevundimonas sp. MF30-B]TFW02828.1 LPS-assembly protein LptD [Brevundimonas sp. S30B]
MPSDRSSPSLKARLLAGAAAFAAFGLATSALAQQGQAAPPTGADGVPPGAVYIDAGSASRQGDIVTARGDEGGRVFSRYRDHSLRAEEVTYDLGQGIASAVGQVELITPEQAVVYASRLELDSDLRAGVAVDFATRLADGSSLMAATAVRRSENVQELNYAVFTPCPICDADGPKTPSISIQAEQVVQDEALRAILYRNAVFKLGGVPILYLPVFAHPDPTVERASGFLIPTINYDEGRGLSAEIPYLHVISPSQDVLISPQINSRVAPLLNLQWRRRFSDGVMVARGGYTYERNFGDFDLDGDGDAESNVKFGPRENRSYILSWGRFDPDGPWRWGFTAERTSDKTLFDRYDIRDPYQDNGLYYGDSRRLITQLYAERQTRRSYVSIAAFTLQSLRVSQFDPVTPALNVFEDDSTLPVVAPLIDARWEPEAPVLGGRLRLRGSAVSLTRDAYIGAPILRPEVIPADPTGLGGVESRRITGQIEWRRILVSPLGVRWEPFLDGRLDAYAVEDLPPLLGADDATLTRGRASVGVDVSYPLYRPLGGGELIVEPMAQLSASTRADLDPRIPNEDSQTLELDQYSLFRMDRFPGYDLLEGGLRFTAGARASLRWDEGRSASLFVGRSYRADRSPEFQAAVPDDPSRVYDPSGLASRTSDWVVQGEFSPSDRIRGWGHATIDGNGEIRRAEASVDGRWGRRNLASLSYIVDRSNPVDGPLNRNYEFVQLAAQQFVLGNWGVSVAGIADLEQNIITRQEVGLVFDDDCFRIEVGYRRDNTRVRPTGPSDGIYLRLNLATFGGTR